MLRTFEKGINLNRRLKLAALFIVAIMVGVSAFLLTEWPSDTPVGENIELQILSGKVTYEPLETATIRAKIKNWGQDISNISVALEITDPFNTQIHFENMSIEKLNVGESKWVQTTWEIPEIRLSGFVARATIVNSDEKVIASDHYVFDVAADWAQVPRYGFFAVYPEEFENVDRKINQMVDFHINSVQFYDWFEHHGNYTPTKTTYAILDKPISRSRVIEKIEKANQHGMKTLAYTAIYAAAEPVHDEHPEWALTDKNGQPLMFANWLYFMNPSPQCGWHDYLIEQFVASIEMFGWDGIHLDQYGEGWTRNAYWGGTRVDMENAFLRLINDAVEEMKKHDPQSKLIFNLVNAWPYEVIARYSMSNPTYIEVWSPWDKYADIQMLISLGKNYNKEKAVVLAAYTPNWLPSILLLDSVIFANQGFHIELGEGNGILTDPYFPLYEELSEDAGKALALYYECITRYGAYIYDEDIQRLPEETVWIFDHGSSSIPRAGNILVIPYSKSTDGREEARIVHLVNFVGIDDMGWKSFQMEPTGVTDIQMEIQIPANAIDEIEGVYFITPDSGSSDPVPLEYETDVSTSAIKITAPSLKYWDTIIVRFS